MTFNYTQAQKDAIKRNPLNRENCKSIRSITINYYRSFQTAERAFASLSKSTPDKQRKESASALQTAKDSYETALGKLKLYQEIYPEEKILF